MSSPLFDCLNAINDKTSYTYKKKDCSGYMLTMWLSHDPDLIGMCNDINPLVFGLPDAMIYKYFRKRVPRKKRYIRWTKKTKASEAKETEIQELMDEHNLSSREAKLSLRRK